MVWAKGMGQGDVEAAQRAALRMGYGQLGLTLRVGAQPGRHGDAEVQTHPKRGPLGGASKT